MATDSIAAALAGIKSIVDAAESKTAALRKQLNQKVAEAQALRKQIEAIEGEEVQNARDTLQHVEQLQRQMLRRKGINPNVPSSK